MQILTYLSFTTMNLLPKKLSALSYEPTKVGSSCEDECYTFKSN